MCYEIKSLCDVTSIKLTSLSVYAIPWVVVGVVDVVVEVVVVLVVVVVVVEVSVVEGADDVGKGTSRKNLEKLLLINLSNDRNINISWCYR